MTINDSLLLMFLDNQIVGLTPECVNVLDDQQFDLVDDTEIITFDRIGGYDVKFVVFTSERDASCG